MHTRHWALWLLAMATAGWGDAEAGTAIWLGPGAAPVEREAAQELQRYLYAVRGEVLPVRETARLDQTASGFVLGTAATLPALESDWDPGLPAPGADGYVLASLGTEGRLVAITGPVPRGVRNGVFGLLEHLGYGFYLGGDTLPDTAPFPGEAAFPRLAESRTPAFAVRGTLPWLNFFDSPTTWEPEDYRAFIDALVRTRMNFVGFHTYDGEPFAAFEWEGRLVDGEPLASTAVSTWGTQPTPTDQFLAGTGNYFARPHFGAASSFIADRAAAIAAAKSVMRDALAYARRRAVTVCLGFEVSGDPTDPAAQARFEARLRAMLADYPMLDCVWLWQPEAMGLTPALNAPQRGLWDSYTTRWSEAFSGIPEAARRAEAVRVALFGIQARQILAAARPDVRLVMSGWGGDQHLHMSDFYPGMDRVMPADVAFSALDNIRMTETVSAAYGELAPDRQRWPIVWHECDGDQWVPQPNVRKAAGACRDAAAKGCQGLLGIHWRTRDVEESAAYCARYAWDPELTVEGFFRRVAEDRYGPARAERMAPLLVRLEDLGYRWVGGGGQDECARFRWGVGTPEHRAALREIAEALRQELALEGGPASPREPERRAAVADLLAQVEYVLAYDATAELMQPKGELDRLIGEGQTAAAVDLVCNSPFAKALYLHAGRMRTKGELGVLATINAKAWADVRARLTAAGADVTPLEATPEGMAGTPRLLVLPDRVIVTGLPADGLRVTVRARALGAEAWQARELACLGRTTFAFALPEGLAEGPCAYGVEAAAADGTALTWPEGFPRAVRTGLALGPVALPAPAAATVGPPEPVQAASRVDTERGILELTWTPQPGCAYAVERDGASLGTVYDGWVADARVPSGRAVTYTIRTQRLTDGATATVSVPVTVPELPLPAPPAKVDVASRGGRVMARWVCDAANAVAYEALLARPDGSEVARRRVDAAPGRTLEVAERVPPGEPYAFTVSGVAPDGRVGTPSPPVSVTAVNEPPEPVLHLTFRADPGQLHGLAQLAEQGLALGGAGWAELPAHDRWDPRDALTISLWVKLDDLEGMPVLVCKGAWLQAGYFLQVLNGTLRFYLAGVDTLDAGRPTAGEWHHIAATYGPGEMRLYLDGQLAGAKSVGGYPKASPTALLVGRYAHDDPVYYVRGMMDDVRLYDLALTPEEVAELSAAGHGAPAP